MGESLKESRQARSRKFNEFTNRILKYEGVYPKIITRELANYRRLFTALLGDDELYELAKNDLRWLTIIELYIEVRNTEQA